MSSYNFLKGFTNVFLRIFQFLRMATVQGSSVQPFQLSVEITAFAFSFYGSLLFVECFLKIGRFCQTCNMFFLTFFNENLSHDLKIKMF